MSGTAETILDPIDPTDPANTDEDVGTNGGPGNKPPIKRGVPRDDENTTDGGPGNKPPPKMN